MEVHETVDEFREYAEHDKDNTLESHGRGYYQCYCKTNGNYSSDADFEMDKQNLCSDYFDDQTKVLILGNAISGSTILLNFIL
jgi:hypothetical protein